MSTTQTSPRMDLTADARAPYSAMLRLEQSIELDERLKLLVKVRVSQINGCAFCVDMHWPHARDEGESELRLAHLATWHESPYFDERERAALALAESITHIADTHVPDDVWEQAAQHFDRHELASLVFAITAINAWNRLAVTARSVPLSVAQQSAA